MNWTKLRYNALHTKIFRNVVKVRYLLDPLEGVPFFSIYYDTWQGNTYLGEQVVNLNGITSVQYLYYSVVTGKYDENVDGIFDIYQNSERILVQLNEYAEQDGMTVEVRIFDNMIATIIATDYEYR